MRTTALALCLCALGCASRPAATTATATPTAAPAAAPAPRAAPVVVTIVVDQFAAWIAEERLPLLPETGGFARLRREGTWYRHVRYGHAATDTAPGHSSLYTGRAPRESGILANEVPDARGERVSILRDEAAHVVTDEGVTDAVGSSIARLRVDTLADALRARSPGAVIVSVSLKDRGAIFGGGRRPTATLWFDPGRDRFVTSTAFGQTLPVWVNQHGLPPSLTALRATPWTLSDEPWVRAHAATPDEQPGEGDLDGWGTTFPHDFARARRPAGALRASPMGDTAVLTLAGDALAAARDPQQPMLLAISLSSNDYIGHLFGPDSWEAWDQLRRLDASLGQFFQRLDSTVGADGWSLVLSADHGIISLPEIATIPAARPWCDGAAARGGRDPYERPCGALGRLDPDAVARELQATAVRVLGEGRWVRGVADPYVYLTDAAEALPGPRREALQAAMTARLREHPEIERVLDTRTVAASCAEGESVEALLCRAIPDRNGAALYAQARAGSFFDPGYALGRGASHGSPYLFDRTVPMLVRAPGREPAGRVVDEPTSFAEFRREAERLLGM
jgi:hypothetical protein